MCPTEFVYQTGEGPGLWFSASTVPSGPDTIMANSLPQRPEHRRCPTLGYLLLGSMSQLVYAVLAPLGLLAGGTASRGMSTEQTVPECNIRLPR